MTKSEFLSELRAALREIYDHDVEERISFYSEMIDDLIDDGMSEEEAVERVGPVERITDELLRATPLFELVKRKVTPRRKLVGWEIALIAMSSPIWLSLIAAAIVLVIALTVTMWSTVVSLWAVLLSCGVGAACGILGGIAMMFTDSPLVGLMLTGSGITLAGLSIFVFYVCKMATKGTAALFKAAFLGIKRLFV